MTILKGIPKPRIPEAVLSVLRAKKGGAMQDKRQRQYNPKHKKSGSKPDFYFMPILL